MGVGVSRHLQDAKVCEINETAKLEAGEGEFPRFPLGTAAMSTSIALGTYLEIGAPYSLLLTPPLL